MRVHIRQCSFAAATGLVLLLPELVTLVHFTVHSLDLVVFICVYFMHSLDLCLCVCILCFCFSYCIYIVLLSAQLGGHSGIEA